MIRNHIVIRGKLEERFRRLGLTNRDVVNDAGRLGYKITESAISKYFRHGDSPGSLTEKDIIFLCCRWDIELDLQVILHKRLDKERIIRSLTDFLEKDELYIVKNLIEQWDVLPKKR